VSFSIDRLRFIDSYQFMSSLLEILTENLKKTGKHTVKYFPKKILNLVTRKGVCLYDYIDDFSIFNETALHSICEFYSELNGSHISQTDYGHTQNIWRKFNCKTLRDYLRIYLKVDVLTQADVFETFRDVCMKKYSLDPLHYYTVPGLAWDALFKYTVHLQELMIDPDMYLFCEQGIRGGISMICNRYAKANNKYMKDYDNQSPSTYIASWDANNLYGKAMSEKLPVGKYRWLSAKDIANFDIFTISDDSNIGYIVECDLEYPEKLHDLYNDYPLTAENIQIPGDMLSSYNNKALKKNNNIHTICTKLTPNLMNKTKYICHYKNL
jgi:hypothetical protein